MAVTICDFGGLKFGGLQVISKLAVVAREKKVLSIQEVNVQTAYLMLVSCMGPEDVKIGPQI